MKLSYRERNVEVKICESSVEVTYNNMTKIFKVGSLEELERELRKDFPEFVVRHVMDKVRVVARAG